MTERSREADGMNGKDDLPDTSAERHGIVEGIGFEIPAPARFKGSSMNMVPHLSRLQHELLEKLERRLAEELDDEERFDERRALLWSLEMLPYALDAARNAIRNFLRIQSELANEAIPQRTPDAPGLQRFVLQSWPLGHCVDSFLEAAARTQDAVPRYLTAGLGHNFGTRLRPVMSSDAHEDALPASLFLYMKEYWDRSGEKLRAYRVLSQHYAIVTSEAEVFNAENEELGIRHFLPNNPEVKSNRRIRYEEPRVHAYPFMKLEFCRLLGFVYSVTRMLLEGDDSDPRQISEMLLRVPATSKLPLKGVRLVTPKEFDDAVEEVLGTLDDYDWS